MAYITVKQAADMLSVHPNTVRNWINAGILTRYQVNPGYRILLKTEDIERAIKRGDVTDEDDSVVQQ